MERETIEKAARDYAKGNAFCTNDMTSIFCEMMGLDKQIANGFVIGAQWRIDSVWHNMSEKPNGLFVILADFGEEEYSLGITLDGIESAKRWAYVSDLLPDRKDRK